MRGLRRPRRGRARDRLPCLPAAIPPDPPTPDLYPNAVSGPQYSNSGYPNGATDWMRPEIFGAAPLPIVDSTTGIQAALNATPPGGIFYLPRGVWTTTAPLIKPSGVEVWGAARSLGIPTGNFGIGGLPLIGSIIQPAAGFAGSSAWFMTDDGVHQAGGGGFRRISVDGSQLPGGNAVHGIQSVGAVAAVTLEDVLVWGTGGNGLDAQKGTGIANPDFWDVRHSKFSACGGQGIHTIGLADTTWTVVESTGNNGDNWNVSNGNNSRYLFCKGENSATGWDWNIFGLTGFTGYAEWLTLSAAGGALGAIQVSGPGTGIFYFADTHTLGGTVSLTGTNTVKSTPAWTTGSIVTS